MQSRTMAEDSEAVAAMAAALRDARAKSELSLGVAADRFGVSPKRLASWEAGQRVPEGIFRRALTRRYGIPAVVFAAAGRAEALRYLAERNWPASRPQHSADTPKGTIR